MKLLLLSQAFSWPPFPPQTCRGLVRGALPQNISCPLMMSSFGLSLLPSLKPHLRCHLFSKYLLSAMSWALCIVTTAHEVGTSAIVIVLMRTAVERWPDLLQVTQG